MPGSNPWFSVRIVLIYLATKGCVPIYGNKKLRCCNLFGASEFQTLETIEFPRLG